MDRFCRIESDLFEQNQTILGRRKPVDDALEFSIVLGGYLTLVEDHDRLEDYQACFLVVGTLNLPFSEAVKVGNLLILSGRIGNIPGTLELASGGIQGETRQAMENIKATVEKYGASMDQVVKCTVFLADMAEWGLMNEVYKQYFPTNKPTRSALGASGLALGALVEIECMAALD